MSRAYVQRCSKYALSWNGSYRNLASRHRLSSHQNSRIEQQSRAFFEQFKHILFEKQFS